MNQLKVVENYRTDGIIENAMSGMGNPEYDRTMHTTVRLARPRLRKNELEALYWGSWICRTIIDAYPQESTRKWIEVTLGGKPQNHKQIRDFNKYQEKLGVRKAFAKADKWSRLYGGAAIIVIVEDGQPLDRPIKAENIRSIRKLMVLDRHKIRPELANADPEDPEFYLLTLPPYVAQELQKALGQNEVVESGLRVHKHRVIRFDGIAMPPDVLSENEGWGSSIFDSVKDTFDRYESVNNGIANMVEDASVFIWKMKNLAELLSKSDEKSLAILKNRLRSIRQMKSNMKMLAIDADKEEATYLNRPLTGLPEISDRQTSALIGASRMPATILFGRGPLGLSAQGTGDTEEAVWAKLINQHQTDNYQERLRSPEGTNGLFDFIWMAQDGPSKGKVPDDWNFKWLSLMEMTDLEKATLRSQQSTTDNAYIQGGVLLKEEVRQSRFGGSEYSIETTLDEDLWEEQQQQSDAFDQFNDYGMGSDPNAPPDENGGGTPGVPPGDDGGDTPGVPPGVPPNDDGTVPAAAGRTDSADKTKYLLNRNGVSIGITHEPGDMRHDRPMRAAYGRIRGSYGAAEDGKAIDAYLGPNPESQKVFKVRQNNPDGSLDESKWIFGCNTLQDARQLYLDHIPAMLFGGIDEADIGELSQYRTDCGEDCGCEPCKAMTKRKRKKKKLENPERPLDDLEGESDREDAACGRGYIFTAKKCLKLTQSNEDGGKLYDLHDNGENVAYAKVVDNGDRYFLSTLEVKPTHQNQGIGRALLEHVISEKGDMPIETLARPFGKQTISQGKLVNIYTKAGFQPVEERAGGLYMRRESTRNDEGQPCGQPCGESYISANKQCQLENSKSRDVYQESEDSIFSTNGKEYSVNKLLHLTHNRKAQDFQVNDLKWNLEDGTNRNPSRVEQADLKFPILVTKDEDDWLLVVNGAHRLTKAIREGNTTIQGKWIEPQEMQGALIEKNRQDTATETDLADYLTDRAMQDSADGVQAWLSAIGGWFKQRQDEGLELADAAERLPELYDQLDGEQFAETLAQSMMLGELAGRQEVLEEVGEDLVERQDAPNRSHKGTPRERGLVKKQIINKSGEKQTVWIRSQTAKIVGGTAAAGLAGAVVAGGAIALSRRNQKGGESSGLSASDTNNSSSRRGKLVAGLGVGVVAAGGVAALAARRKTAQSDENPEMPGGMKGDIVFRAQALDNLSPDPYVLSRNNEQQILTKEWEERSPKEQEIISQLVSDMGEVRSKGEEIDGVYWRGNHFAIQFETHDLDVAGRQADVVIYGKAPNPNDREWFNQKRSEIEALAKTQGRNIKWTDRVKKDGTIKVVSEPDRPSQSTPPVNPVQPANPQERATNFAENLAKTTKKIEQRRKAIKEVSQYKSFADMPLPSAYETVKDYENHFISRTESALSEAYDLSEEAKSLHKDGLISQEQSREVIKRYKQLDNDWEAYLSGASIKTLEERVSSYKSNFDKAKVVSDRSQVQAGLSDWQSTLKSERFKSAYPGTKESDAVSYAGAVLQHPDSDKFRGLQDNQGRLQAGAIVTDKEGYLLVNYLASAPHNMIEGHPNRVSGAGLMMIGSLIEESIAKGHGGRLILDGQSGTALPFYRMIGFEKGEMSAETAQELLQNIKKSMEGGR